MTTPNIECPESAGLDQTLITQASKVTPGVLTALKP